jgi:hypothetical protein
MTNKLGKMLAGVSLASALVTGYAPKAEATPIKYSTASEINAYDQDLTREGQQSKLTLSVFNNSTQPRLDLAKTYTLNAGQDLTFSVYDITTPLGWSYNISEDNKRIDLFALNESGYQPMGATNEFVFLSDSLLFKQVEFGGMSKDNGAFNNEKVLMPVNIPEASTLGLIGAVGLGLVAARRFFRM